MYKPQIVYPFPMHLSQGYTYHLSILQFLCALSNYSVVHLISLDTKEQIQDVLWKQFDQTLPDSFRIHTINNRRFGLKSNSLFFFPRILSLIVKIAGTYSHTCVYTRNVKTASYLFPQKTKKLKKIKFIFECHQIYSINLAIEKQYDRAKVEAKLERNIYTFADIVFTNTDLLGKLIQRDYNANVIKLPLAVREEDILDTNMSSNSEKIYDFIYCGTFSRWKGVETLVSALHTLKKDGWSGKALFVGMSSDQQSDWSLKLNALELTRQIELVQKQPKKNIQHYLDKAKIGVIPNALEGDSILSTSPLKLYDYAARGLHIVASQVPALCSEIELEDLYWSRPEDEADLASKMSLAMNNWTRTSEKNIAWAQLNTWNTRALAAISHLEDLFLDTRSHRKPQ